MADLVNKTKHQYQTELLEAYEAGLEQGKRETETEAYERGRQDERKHAREVATEVIEGFNQHQIQDTIYKYLSALGWKYAASKANGLEFVDKSGAHRIGVPKKITPKSWTQLATTLAKYYARSPQDIVIDIKSYR